jgi:ribosomal protein S12 methylthiotransferase accessory factor
VLTAEGARVIPPDVFAQYRTQTYWSDDFIIDWAPAVELLGGDRVWLPASAVYSGVTPCLHDFTANGLASGNHVVEATLHGIYEVIERDTVSRLNVFGRIALTPPACRAVDLSTLDGVVRDLCVRLDGAGITPVLLAVASPTPFHTFWAALIDRAPFSAASTVNVGYGTHLSPTVAAVRALTEAAQSRVCYIHGAREDLAIKMREQTNQVLQRIAATFLRLQPSAAWPDFEDFSTSTLSDDATKVFRSLAESGIAAVYRVDLSRKPYNVPVVKILIPGMLINRRFF